MKRVIEILIDDIDGKETGPGGQTVKFGLDGIAYEVDLNSRNATALRAALEPFVSAGTMLAKSRLDGTLAKPKRSYAHAAVAAAAAAATTTTAARKRERAEVVAWLKSRGITAPDRGRLKQQYYDDYAEWQRKRTVEAITGPTPQQRKPPKAVPAATFEPPAATVREKPAAPPAAAPPAAVPPVRRSRRRTPASA